MGPFFKTLFGDFHNIAVVAGLVAAETLLLHFGLGRAATVLVPVAAMAGVAWLAARS